MPWRGGARHLRYILSTTQGLLRFSGRLLLIEPNVCVSGDKEEARHSGDSLLYLVHRL